MEMRINSSFHIMIRKLIAFLRVYTLKRDGIGYICTIRTSTTPHIPEISTNPLPILQPCHKQSLPSGPQSPSEQ